MKLSALGVEPGLTGRMIEHNIMAVMAGSRIITVSSVDVMALIADRLVSLLVYMSVIIAMNPSGFSRCFLAA